MPRPIRGILLVLAAAGLLDPRPARAQAPVDSAGIARAAASFIAEELLPELKALPGVSLAPPGTRFDSLVARELAGRPAFQRAPRDAALTIGTQGLTEMPGAPEHLRGLPAVIVRVSGCTRNRHWGGGWHGWSNQVYYVFRQTDRGWKVAGGRTLDNADGGCSPPAEEG